ncbi:hypothetical protein FGB62_109g13 [Gracilaria domingensis]|nr:hypothetical protein FGB62_109g13 [Gracilaria domingensis]
MYRSGKPRETPPTEGEVSVLRRKFPNLRALHLKNWPYMDTHPEVQRTCVEAHLLPGVLHLEAVVFDADDMLAAMAIFEQLEHIVLLRSKSIDDDLLQKMGVQGSQRDNMRSKLVVSRAGRVTGPGVSALIASSFADVMKFTHCSDLLSIEKPQQFGGKLQEVILTSKVRLLHVLQKEQRGCVQVIEPCLVSRQE